MSEFRFNPLQGEWVIVASERAARPESFAKPRTEEKASSTDPFAEGNEAMTPPEVYAVGETGRLPDTPGWKVRVVPNKFPALTREILPDAGFLPATPKPGQSALGYGAHEVVISSPSASKSIGQLDQTQVDLIVDTYQRRYRVLAKDKQVQYIQIICNHGREAGASLAHPHSQIFALPFVPARLRREMALVGKSEQLHQAILDQVRQDNLVVFENPEFVVFCPPWSGTPFATMIMPVKPRARFEEMDGKLRQHFVKALRMMLQRIFVKLNDPAYNFNLHTAPTESAGKLSGQESYFWHLSCQPRLSIQAGFEQASEVLINTVAPEQAAAYLRD